MNKKPLTAIDLFAGCGGLSRGFMDAGFNILVGIDNDDMALKTFRHNHGNTFTINADLSKAETFKQIDKAIVGQKIDVIIAGPPCQGFSLTGPRDFDDSRNKLYLAVIKAVKRYNPKGIIIENVPGMAALYDGEIKNEVIRRLSALGYNIEPDILCAADYGVPQIRKRLFFFRRSL
jgi:DNA (cytosine-5)-methyltransferase 1